MGKAVHRSILSPEDQRVTFVELFFDLVFVFSVTQVVGLLHHHLDWTGVGQTVLVFWLVWWGWTQFTWALNAADTTHPSVELATLVATAFAFFMAAGIPNAFSGGSLWFAIPYVLVRVIGLVLYVRVSWESSPEHRTAVKTFALLSVGGLAAVLAGGISGGTTTLSFTDAVWRKTNPPAEVLEMFERDYPKMGWVADILAAIERCEFDLLGRFTLPDEAWWDDFYTPMEARANSLESKYAEDSEALEGLALIVREIELHRKYSEYYAYKFFVAQSPCE